MIVFKHLNNKDIKYYLIIGAINKINKMSIFGQLSKFKASLNKITLCRQPQHLFHFRLINKNKSLQKVQVISFTKKLSSLFHAFKTKKNL